MRENESIIVIQADINLFTVVILIENERYRVSINMYKATHAKSAESSRMLFCFTLLRFETPEGSFQ